MKNPADNEDIVLSGMYAWNILTSLLEGSDELFDDPNRFKSFYAMMIDRLFEEEVSE